MKNRVLSGKSRGSLKQMQSTSHPSQLSFTKVGEAEIEEGDTNNVPAME